MLKSRINIFTPLLLLLLAVAIGISIHPVGLASQFRLLSEPFTTTGGPTNILKCNCLPGYLAKKTSTGSYVCMKLSDMKTTLACY